MNQRPKDYGEKTLQEALKRYQNALDSFHKLSGGAVNDRLVYEIKAAEEAFSHICSLYKVV